MDAGGLARRAVAISALGYFVDIFDLFLFSVLRVPSLAGVGVLPERSLAAGTLVLNCQMAGLLIGSFFWGVLGDRRGRVRALYGSILLYSVATLANALVGSLHAYAACRFFAGLGLAGELGAAVTLVSETLPTQRRGIGTMVVAAFGFCGGIAAAGMAELSVTLWGGAGAWRICYAIGGLLGLLLLGLRVGLMESPLFAAAAGSRPRSRLDRRGDLRLLFASARRRRIYLRLVLTGLPIWFVAGILMVFSPEIGRALDIPGVTAARAVLFAYIGVAIGDFLSGLLSQLLRSRRRALALFLGFVGLSIAVFLRARAVSPAVLYALCFALGIGTGYWAVLITAAAEHFGTNLRATVATTVPNLIRASAIPLTLGFGLLGQRYGLIPAAMALGAACVVLALWALAGLDETFSRDLDFEEPS